MPQRWHVLLIAPALALAGCGAGSPESTAAPAGAQAQPSSSPDTYAWKPLVPARGSLVLVDRETRSTLTEPRRRVRIFCLGGSTTEFKDKPAWDGRIAWRRVSTRRTSPAPRSTVSAGIGRRLPDARAVVSVVGARRLLAVFDRQGRLDHLEIASGDGGG